MDGLCMGGSGAGYGTRKKGTKIRVGADTMKALAFNWPYWPLVAQRMLFLGDYLVKTRDAPWNYLGPVLAYTNSRIEQGPHIEYGFDLKHKIDGAAPALKTLHGVAELVDVRPLLDGEKLILYILYNNLSPSLLCSEKHRAFALGQGPNPCEGPIPYIRAMEFGYFFRQFHAFRRPIPIKWPSTGQFANVPLTRNIRQQLPDWACA